MSDDTLFLPPFLLVRGLQKVNLSLRIHSYSRRDAKLRESRKGDTPMPESLMRSKIKEALVATGHNRHDAHKLLITWAVRDPALLLAMTKPHLKAIAAGHIDHFMRQIAEDAGDDSDSEKLSRSTIDDIVASASLRLPSDKRRNTVVPPPKSTERQASTMRKLAAAFTKKK